MPHCSQLESTRLHNVSFKPGVLYDTHIVFWHTLLPHNLQTFCHGTLLHAFQKWIKTKQFILHSLAVSPSTGLLAKVSVVLGSSLPPTFYQLIYRKLVFNNQMTIVETLPIQRNRGNAWYVSGNRWVVRHNLTSAGIMNRIRQSGAR